MQFDVKHAVALSNFTILGGSLMNLVLNYRKRHPLADKPVIDMDLIIMMEPMTIAGAIAGSYLNIILPSLISVVLLALTLIFTCIRMLQKGCKRFRSETKLHEQKLALIERDEMNEEEEAKGDEFMMEMTSRQGSSENDCQEISCRLDEVLKQELHELQKSEKHISPLKVGLLIFCISTVTLLFLLQDQFCACGSISFWAVTVAAIMLVIGFSACVRRHLLSQVETKRRLGYEFVEGDVQWNEKTTVLYPCVCILAGLCAGLFGVGGGIVKGPLMVEMGVHPSVATATSATMILFTSVAASVTEFALGMITLDYGVALFIVALMSTLVGQLIVSYLINKFGRPSINIFSIATLVGIAAVVLLIRLAMNSSSTNAMWTLHSLCSSK